MFKEQFSVTKTVNTYLTLTAELEKKTCSKVCVCIDRLRQMVVMQKTDGLNLCVLLTINVNMVPFFIDFSLLLFPKL